MPTALVDRDVIPYDYLADRLDDALGLRRAAADTEAEAIDALGDAEILVTTSRVPVTERVLAESTLDHVAKFGTGVDSIDLDAAREAGVTVTYTPGLNALGVAEHTVTLLLAASRRLVAQQEHLQAGGWRDEVPLGAQLSGSTVGIVGFGNVGRRVATLLEGFHVDVLAYDPYVPAEDGEPFGVDLVDLEALLAASDAVTVNAELTAETHHLIDEAALATMRESAFLVNTARGPIVAEDALVAALEAGEIAGAGLDVFESEPLAPDHPLFAFDNVVTTPHSAAMTVQTHEHVLDRIVDTLRAYLDGERIPERYVAVSP
jgi:phosphoglycerate dehydrogenase-like enzyme